MSNDKKLTLTVYENSPHIWAGGLEGEDLAKWLLGRANAILFAEEQERKLRRASDEFSDLFSYQPIKNAYAALGVSQRVSDPIHPLSTEAIQLDQIFGCAFRSRFGSSHNPANPLMPAGYVVLPDLREESEECRKKIASLSDPASILFGKKSGD